MGQQPGMAAQIGRGTTPAASAGMHQPMPMPGMQQPMAGMQSMQQHAPGMSQVQTLQHMGGAQLPMGMGMGMPQAQGMPQGMGMGMQQQMPGMPTYSPQSQMAPPFGAMGGAANGMGAVACGAGGLFGS